MNWEGISRIIEPIKLNYKTGQMVYINRHGYPLSENRIAENNNVIRSKITWKMNFLTLIYNKFPIFKEYPSKYTMYVVREIFFPPSFDERFYSKLLSEQEARRLWINLFVND